MENRPPFILYNFQKWKFGEVNEAGFGQCLGGEIHRIYIEEFARRCGLGTIFTIVCLIDKDMNEPNGNTKPPLAEHNEALKTLAAFKGFKEYTEWAKGSCRNLWSLVFLPTEVAGGKAYFNAALVTGYSKMLIVGKILICIKLAVV